MPNHVRNVIKIIGSEKNINELMDFVSNKESPFSFENIIPMPPEEEVPTKYEKYPMPKWYNWRCEMWGTKWDAYDIEAERFSLDNVQYSFSTAWSSPIPVLVALSKKYPELRFEIEYADEDLGYNIGDIVLQTGIILEHQCVVEGSNEAFEKAITLWNMQDQYQLIDGEYVYIDPLGLN